MIERLLSTAEAATLLGLARHTLEQDRSTKRLRIPYLKIGRSVRYRPEDIAEYISRLSSSSHITIQNAEK